MAGKTGRSITKTRIAPTPTGYLHLGNVYNFALTASLAKKYNASILLRIDDIDHQRVNNAYVQDIFETLQFLGIPWDEGPRNIHELEQTWSQKHRMGMYEAALQQLRADGAVFACSCSRSTVLLAGRNGQYPGTCLRKCLPLAGNAWRLDTTNTHPAIIQTLDVKTEAELPAEMQYFVVNRKDGCPAYQLTSVVDDVHFGVDLVVRGTDLWASTIAQHCLARQLKQPTFAAITFHHHDLLTSSDGKKLSKSAGSTSVQYLRKQGKTAADIYAMVGEMAGIGPLSGWEEIVDRLGV
jgi:glutamyl-tRNA synthetase